MPYHVRMPTDQPSVTSPTAAAAGQGEPSAAREPSAPRDPATGPAPHPQRSLRQRLVPVLVFSLSVTACAGLVALLLDVVGGLDGLLAFVYLRWGVVFTLIATPIVHRTARGRLPLPYVLQTPFTALLLTCESIVVDIVIAQLRH